MRSPFNTVAYPTQNFQKNLPEVDIVLKTYLSFIKKINEWLLKKKHFLKLKH